ncbi:MAG: DNA polymerase-3 subunit epsilon [Ulvibacter sp.]|jgi:DNA polymerase-3 subunit epsilon
MIKRFLKNRLQKYPVYWESYVKLFDEQSSTISKQAVFIALDTETTGFDFELDRIISIGAVVISNNEISIAESFEIYIKQERFSADTVEFHGMIKNEKVDTLTEEQALEQLLGFIGNAILVAHHAKFDVTMINKAMKRNGLPKLKNKVLDTVNLYRSTRIRSNLIDQNKNYSLDEIAENYGINVSDRHTAAGDALITALIFLKTLSKLNMSKSLTLKELLRIR